MFLKNYHRKLPVTKTDEGVLLASILDMQLFTQVDDWSNLSFFRFEYST